MTNNNTNHSDKTEEIDLMDIKNAIASFIEAIGFFIFRQWYLILIGLLISVFINFQHIKTYLVSENNVRKELSYSILLAPQFESIDYLDQLVSSNFKDKIVDEAIQKAKLIGIDDLYTFLEKDSLRVSIFKSINSKLEIFEEAIHNYPLSKNYRFQLLQLDVSSTFNIDEFLLKLNNHFDDNVFFRTKQKIENERIDNQLIVLRKVLEPTETIALKSIDAVKLQQYAIDQIAKLEQEKVTTSNVIYVVDYFKVERDAAGLSPMKKLIIDSFKYVVLLLLLGGVIDLLRYYKKKK